MVDGAGRGVGLLSAIAPTSLLVSTSTAVTLNDGLASCNDIHTVVCPNNW